MKEGERCRQKETQIQARISRFSWGNHKTEAYRSKGPTKWWWTGRPGALQFMGSQRVRHDWSTELNWSLRKLSEYVANKYWINGWMIGNRKTIFPVTQFNQVQAVMELLSGNSLLNWSGGFLSRSFACWIFLCLCILLSFPCLGSPFCGLEGHNSS